MLQTMKMEAQRSLETFVNIHQFELRNAPDDLDLQPCLVGGKLDTWTLHACASGLSSSVHIGV